MNARNVVGHGEMAKENHDLGYGITRRRFKDLPRDKIVKCEHCGEEMPNSFLKYHQETEHSKSKHGRND